MQNKFGMEIIGYGTCTTINNELVMIHIDENEVLEEVNDSFELNDLFHKITKLDNIRKVVANHFDKHDREYTKEELLTTTDEEFVEFMGIGIKNIQDNYYKVLVQFKDDFYEYELEDFSRNKNNTFKVDIELKYCAGIYIIQKDNDIYIGQSKNLYQRFCAHMYNKKDKANPTFLLKNGGTFKLLELEEDKEIRLIKERQYVEQYIKDGYNVLNSIKVLFSGENKLTNQKQLEEYQTDIIFDKSDLDKITQLLKDNNIDFKLKETT